MRRLIRSYVRPYTGPLLAALFFMLVAAGTTAAVAQLMQPVLDDVLSGHKKNLVVPIGLAVLVTALATVMMLRRHNVYEATARGHLDGWSEC